MIELRSRLSEVEQKLQYTFKQRGLLEEALTHRSYSNEHHGTPYNQRLEFLGDSALGLIVGHAVCKLHPNAEEGELTKLKARLVDATTCAKYARLLGLGDYILLGLGEAAKYPIEVS